MRLLYISDSHIKGVNPSSRKGNYYQDVMKKMSEVISLSKELKVDGVLHGGDLFDSNKVSNLIVDDFVDKVEEAGIMWYVVPGNHDSECANWENSKGTSLAHIFRRSRYIKLCEWIHGQGYSIQGFKYYHNIEQDIKEKGLNCHDKHSRLKIAITHSMITLKPFHPDVLHVVAKDIKTDFDVVLCAHFHCTSNDTECLTLEGWKKYNQLKIGEKIASFNLNKKIVEYKPLLNLHKYNYKGFMYNIKHPKTGKIDMLITPNHNVIANKNPKKLFPYSKYAYELNTGDHLLINAKKWNYPILHTFKNKYWAELIGFIIGDGSIRRWKSKKAISINIAQKTNNNRRYMKRLLEKCNLDYKFKNKGGIDIWRINYSDSLRYWSNLKINKKNKNFLNWVLNNMSDKKLNRLLISLPPKQLKLLLKGLLKSDGHIYSSNWKVFYQRDYNTIKLVEELCLRIGKKIVTTRKPSSFKPSNWVYSISISNRRNAIINKGNIKKVKYSNVVWCPETDNGTWIAKRKGIPFITGNSSWGIKEINGTKFVNIGCLGRTSINEADVKPSVLFIDTETKELKIINLKTAKSKEEVFDLERIEKTKEFNIDIQNFIESLKDTKISGLDLRGIIENIGSKENIDKDIITEAIERVGTYEI